MRDLARAVLLGGFMAGATGIVTALVAAGLLDALGGSGRGPITVAIGASLCFPALVGGYTAARADARNPMRAAAVLTALGAAAVLAVAREVGIPDVTLVLLAGAAASAGTGGWIAERQIAKAAARHAILAPKHPWLAP